MCNKVVSPYTSAIPFDSLPGQYMALEMCEKVVSKEPFMLRKNVW